MSNKKKTQDILEKEEKGRRKKPYKRKKSYNRRDIDSFIKETGDDWEDWSDNYNYGSISR